MIHQRSNAKAITKIKPRPKQINEYRGLGTINERRDLAKKRIIDKFSEPWEAYLILFPCHNGKERTCRIDNCSVNCRICEGRSCANAHNIPYKAYMGNSPKCHLHAMNHFSIVMSSVWLRNHCVMSFYINVICLLKKERKTFSKRSQVRLSGQSSNHKETKSHDNWRVQVTVSIKDKVTCVRK